MSTFIDISRAVWEKSSYSNGNGGQCIEFARGFEGVVPVRDSKNPSPVIAVSADAWGAFVRHVKG
ncbi:DUF397 domain-containing protein [Streptomyces sp. 6N223]|uniref:DUF397 domain-containing protein n=1 Tax=Streptomyces sp. 6N223 TaxID=3457412 RepID=UPI003FCF9536